MPPIEQLAERRVYQVAQSDTPAYRTPPHNLEAEQALLGAILVNNDAYRPRLRLSAAGAFFRGIAPADL